MSSSAGAWVNKEYFQVGMFDLIRVDVDDEDDARGYYESENKVYADKIESLLPRLTDAFTRFRAQVDDALVKYESEFHLGESYSITELKELYEAGADAMLPKRQTPEDIILRFHIEEESRRSELSLRFTLVKAIGLAPIKTLADAVVEILADYKNTSPWMDEL